MKPQGGSKVLIELRRCGWIALLVGVPVSLLFLFVGGALVHANSTVTILLLFPGALLLTRQVATGAMGIALYLVVQFAWWIVLVAIVRRLWVLLERLR